MVLDTLNGTGIGKVDLLNASSTSIPLNDFNALDDLRHELRIRLCELTMEALKILDGGISDKCSSVNVLITIV